MTRSTWPALLLVAFLLGGCGLTGSAKKGPPPKTMSHAQLVHAVKQASRRFVRQAKRAHYEAGASFVKVERAERTIVIPAYEHFLFTLQGLTPPPADAAGYRKMLGSLNNLDVILQDYFDELDLALTNQDHAELMRAKRLLQRIKRLTKRLNSGTKHLGVHLT